MKILKALIFLAIFVAIIYSGIRLGEPYWRYYSFKAKVEDIARFEVKQEEILPAVMQQAQQIGIPISESDVLISGSRGNYVIETGWTESVNLFDVYEHTYNFQLKVGE
ncbi:MAG: hypothetical protein N2257_04455 [Thermodesulfovibrionales bacterium]|nr:hypothetical protein [Thermodesulfovibrionales bacterium]